MTRRVYAVVTGRVQNVGFRYWVLHRAEAQGLSGWVQNMADARRVELEVQGDDTAVEDFVRALHDGPPSARVTAVAVQERAIDQTVELDFYVR